MNSLVKKLRFEGPKALSLGVIAIVGIFLLIAALIGFAVSVNQYLLALFLISPFILIIVLNIGSKRSLLAALGIATIAVFAAFVIWPRYSYLRLGGLPGITPSRVLLALLVLLWIVSLVRFASIRGFVLEWIGRAPLILAAVLALTLFQLISLAVNSPSFAAASVVGNRLLMFGLMYLMASYLLRDIDGFWLFARLLGALTVIVVFIGIAEYFNKGNIFRGIIPVTDDYALSALNIKVRDAVYRTQSTFDHPLTFAQFVVSALPIVFLLAFSEERLWRRALWVFAAALCLVGVYLTNTRSAVVVLILTSAFFLVLVSLAAVSMGRLSLRLLLIGVVCLTLAGILILFSFDGLQGLLAGRTQSEANSTLARVLMYERSLAAVWESPLAGHGIGRAVELVGVVGRRGIVSVDSLLITYAVESGVFALLAYVCIFVFGVVYALHVSRRGGRMVVGVALASSIFGFFLTTFGLSMTGNMFLLAFLLASVSACMRESVSL